MKQTTADDDSNCSWFAVWTRSRREKAAATMLATLGVQNYLPLRSELRQWSDRRQTVEVPLFSGYLFVCINPFKKAWLQVLKVPGIVGFISNQSGPLPIPDRQIEDIRTVLKAKARYWLQPLLQVGGRVRVVRGSLSGVQGTLVRNNLESRLLISIETVSQTLAVNVSVGDVEPLSAEFSLPNRIQSSNTQCSYVL